ncbi:MAG: hypothetical protein A2Y02_03465 [Omnitrophica bacterium GWA2_52_12]|nr:MAG: hypothetical protein A2Y02_03465 [Omnitrophica bacterium GWA2_52_12]
MTNTREVASTLKAVLFMFLGLLLCLNNAYAVLDLQTVVVDGDSTIDFGNMKSLEENGDPAHDSAVRQVRLVVTSDLGRAYTIRQNVDEEPVNEAGTPVSAEAIRFTVEVEDGQGLVRTSDHEPLTAGMQEIYVSDDNEQRTVLLITYDFLVPPGQKAGRYHGMVTFRADAI